jgi:Na+/proline symporter
MRYDNKYLAGFVCVVGIASFIPYRRSRCSHRYGARRHFHPDRCHPFAKNLFRPIFAPAMTDDQVVKLARVMVVVLGLISLLLAIYKSATLVGLLLTGYAGVTQFFPGVV